MSRSLSPPAKRNITQNNRDLSSSEQLLLFSEGHLPEGIERVLCPEEDTLKDLLRFLGLTLQEPEVVFLQDLHQMHFSLL